MSQQRYHPARTRKQRRRFAFDLSLLFSAIAIGVVLTFTFGSAVTSQLGVVVAMVVPAMAEEADPTPTTTAPDQPNAIPTLPADLPSLSQTPVSIALAFDAALNAGDVDGLVDMFNDGAQVKIPPDIYNGSTQIRNWASYLAANHFASEPGLRHVSQDEITWPAEVRSDQLVRFGLASLTGDATLRVSDGKIDSYTFVLTRDSASQLRTAQIAASEILQDPLVVGADLANIYGPNDVFRGTDGVLISYRDMVAAEPGSGPYYDLGGEPVVLRTGL